MVYIIYMIYRTNPQLFGVLLTVFFCLELVKNKANFHLPWYSFLMETLCSFILYKPFQKQFKTSGKVLAQWMYKELYWSYPVLVTLKFHANEKILNFWKSKNSFSWRSETDSNSNILKNIHLILTTLNLILNYCLSTEIYECAGKNSNTVVWLALHYCSGRYNHPEQTLPGLIANCSCSIRLEIPVHL